MNDVKTIIEFCEVNYLAMDLSYKAYYFDKPIHITIHSPIKPTFNCEFEFDSLDNAWHTIKAYYLAYCAENNIPVIMPR